jgi:hypothetical protein
VDDPAGGHGVLERAAHVLLADDLAEALGPIPEAEGYV